MAEKKKSGPTYRTLADPYLDGEPFLSLSVLAKHAYTHLVLVMGGASGIDKYVMEKWYDRTGFTPETAREPLQELREKRLLATEGSIVWVVDYFQRASATHACHNPAHRKQVENYFCNHLPRLRIVNEFATYYGFGLPHPDLGVSGEWAICPEAQRYLAAQNGSSGDGWPTGTAAPGVGPHQLAVQVREILYVDRKNPVGDTESMARGVMKSLLQRNTDQEVIDAARGLAMMREDDRLTDSPPGKSLSVSVLLESGDGWAMDHVARMYLDKRSNQATRAQLNEFLGFVVGSSRFRTSEA